MPGGFAQQGEMRAFCRRVISITACAAGWLAVCIAALMPAAAHALDRTQLAVIINTRDPLSVRIGEYYAAQRQILFQNIIRVGFPAGKSAMTAKEFEALNSWVHEKTVPGVEAYVLTWALPYRVDCMSITSAFAFGFSEAYCAEGCKTTKTSPYFDSTARLPFTQLGIRPTMAIAAANFDDAKALIDRGVAADGTRPEGTAYLLTTHDVNRNVRMHTYPIVEKMLKGRFTTRLLNQPYLKDARDVMFYFIGSSSVEGLDTLHFLPGAIADHLTSAGGWFDQESGQMSSMRWLEAGATGSYGTVVEPCNIVQKFPNPPLVIGHYVQGETLIEAYWKSVQMPGQGIFIGEPLSAPFSSAKHK
ncbi:MAG: hypothetical protein JWN94_1405 [Betaproteobacteria bacterium]|nr:hypothetical protein [Betaproteobacteria bacterium]